MKHHSLFDIRRFKQLLGNDLRINKKPMLIAAAVIVVFWSLLSIGGNISNSLYTFVLYLGGFVLTSRCFKELHDSELAYHYLTLPCSNFERFLSKWLITSVGYAIALLTLFYVYTYVRMTFDFVLFHGALGHINSFDSTIWQNIGTYIVLHSLIFLGAVFFKRYCLLKTTLSLGFLLLILSYFIGSIGIHLFPFWVPTAVENLNSLMTLIHFGFWVVLAPFCWIITYLRISEYEIS